MTTFLRSSTLVGQSSLVGKPRLRSIIDPTPRSVQLWINFHTDHQGDAFNYVTGLATYVAEDAFLTPTQAPILFTADVVLSPHIKPIEYRWDFGDGVIAYGPVVTHTYAAPNPFCQAVLRVTDNLNRVYYARRQMYVYISTPILTYAIT